MSLRVTRRVASKKSNMRLIAVFREDINSNGEADVRPDDANGSGWTWI
jgi:hypothetical protein